MSAQLNFYETWKNTPCDTTVLKVPVDYMEENELVIAYKGDISETFLQTIFRKTEQQLEKKEDDLKTRKKVYNIVVECLQNIFQHSENEEALIAETDPDIRGAIFLVARNRHSKKYFVYTGNFMRNVFCKPLTERIEKVNAMLPEELRAHYVESLGNSEFSDKGGAGLGIIDIARKSGNPLVYKFDKYSDTYCFFTLMVTV